MLVDVRFVAQFWGGTIIKPIIRVYFALLFAVALSGCSSQVEPPSINNNAFRTIDYELCRNASFEFKNQTPKRLRTLFECVNGEDHIIQPYVDLINSISDDDLKVYIESFDRHLSPYLNQAVDVMNRMQERGLLRELSHNISIAVDSGLVSSAVELWRKIYGENENLSPDAMKFQEFVSELIERDRLRGALRSWAGLFDNSNTWALAYLLSHGPAQEVVSAKVADVFAETVGSMIREGDLNSALIFAADRHLYQGLKKLDATDISDMAHLFDVLMSDPSPNGSLVAFQKIHNELSRELQCYSGPNGTRKTLRLDEINAREQLRRRGNKSSLDHLLLVETPFLIASSVRDCDLPGSIIQNYRHVFTLAEKGASPGLAAVNYWVYPVGRLNYLSRNMRSPSLLSYAKIMQWFTARGATGYKFESMRSLSLTDFAGLSSVLTEFATEDLKGDEIQTWIKSQLPKNLQGKALQVLQKLAPPHFHDFIDLMSIEYPEDEATLREALADSQFRNPSSEAFYKLILKAIAPENRKELAAFFAAVAKSWESQQGGVGSLLSVFAESSYLAQENPFQFWIKSLIDDREFFKKWFVTTDRVSQMPEFQKAIEFTGHFSKSQQFDGFLKFMIDIFRYSDQKGLQTPPIEGGFQRPPRREFGAPRPLPPPQVKPPEFKYGSCQKLDGSIWEKGGEIFYQALKCISGDRPDNGLSKLADMLKLSGDLADFTDILGRQVLSKQNANLFLEDLKSWQNNGDLKAMMELLIKSRRIGPDAIAPLEKLLADYLRQGSSRNAAESLGPLLKSRYLGDVLSNLLDVWERDDNQIFFESRSEYVIPLSEKETESLLKQGRERVSNVDMVTVQRALKNFVHRDGNYFHGQYIYEKASEEVIQADVYRMMSLLLRSSRDSNTGDLEELIKAFYDIVEWHRIGKINLNEFVRWGTAKAKAIPYYVLESDTPDVRYVTPFDQLDLLIINSDFSIAGWLPFGVDHLGTYFQIQVAESRNLTETLSDLRSLMQKLLNYGKPFIDKTRYNHLRNNMESFTVLEEANRLGHLIIIQRLYQALYNATPPSDRRKQDPGKNHMNLIHQPTRWAMFSHLVAPLRNIEAQGQLEHFTGIFVQILKSLAPGDERTVRMAFDNLLYRPKGSFSSADYLLTLIFEASKNPAVFDQLKDQLYHGMFATGRIVARSPPFFEMLSELQAPFVGRMIDRYNDRLRSQSVDHDLKLISRLATLNPDAVKLLRTWVTEVSAYSPRGRTHLGEVTDPLLDVINVNDKELIEVVDALVTLLKHPEVKAMNLKGSLRRIFNDYQTVKVIAPQVLANPRDRQTIMDIASRMANEKQIQGMTDAFIEIYENGQLDDLLTLINKYVEYKKP